MSVELTDVFRAATLIQWGLQPKMRPIQNTEYRELVREYMNRSEFRDIVAEMSDGLGLYVLNVSEHGIVLSPREGSVFWLRTSEFRPGSKTSDTRLLDGLVEITIAATVFPRARDLEDDINRPRPPVTVEEIDDSLRAICAALKSEFGDVDPEMDDVKTGLYDAWRVYDSTLSSRETKDGREARMSTTRIIKYNLERLKEYGCFTETRYAGRPAWQPTRRYNVLVQELAASRLYDEIMRIKNGKNADTDEIAAELHDADTDGSAADAENRKNLRRGASVEIDGIKNLIKKPESLDNFEENTEYSSDVKIEFTDHDAEFVDEDDGEADFVDEDDGEADFAGEDDGEADFVDEDDGEADFVDEDDGEADFVDEDDGEAEFVDEDDGEAEFVGEDDGEAEFVDEDDGEADFVDEDDGEAEFVDEDDGEADFVDEDDGEADFVDEDDPS